MSSVPSRRCPPSWAFDGRSPASSWLAGPLSPMNFLLGRRSPFLAWSCFWQLHRLCLHSHLRENLRKLGTRADTLLSEKSVAPLERPPPWQPSCTSPGLSAGSHSVVVKVGVAKGQGRLSGNLYLPCNMQENARSAQGQKRQGYHTLLRAYRNATCPNSRGPSLSGRKVFISLPVLYFVKSVARLWRTYNV